MGSENVTRKKYPTQYVLGRLVRHEGREKAEGVASVIGILVLKPYQSCKKAGLSLRLMRPTTKFPLVLVQFGHKRAT